jgi:hypothetical protein
VSDITVLTFENAGVIFLLRFPINYLSAFVCSPMTM